MNLPDIQDQPDTRNIQLDQVGVAGVRYLTRFNDGVTDQRGVATFDVAIRLPGNRRGTHMSRMVEAIHEQMQDLDPVRLPQVLKLTADRLDVASIQVVVALPIGFLVTAPESGREALQVCDVTLVGQLEDGAATVTTTVATDVTSLCPCSKAISAYGAHNQRSMVALSITGENDDVYPVRIETAFEWIRATGSSPVYPLIKRIDERALTMQAHDRPAFVEDMARDLSLKCRSKGLAHRISAKNFESIHSHNAIAQVSWSGEAHSR